jgi:plasmid stabilization system protein ParE
MENDKYQVIIDPAANSKMYEHFEFLARANVDAAYRLLDSLLSDIKSLESMPFRNPVYNRPYLPVGKYRYMISNKRYHIVYQICDSFVFVDDIQDSRQSDDR